MALNLWIPGTYHTFKGIFAYKAKKLDDIESDLSDPHEI